MNWYYAEEGQQVGPVDDTAFNELVASGKITSATLVWNHTMPNWQPYSEVNPAAAGAVAGVAAGAPAVAVATGVEEAVCSECGNLFPINETIRYNNARVCAACKPVLVQKLSEGMNVSAPGSLTYAGFWTRFGAHFLDSIILYVVNMGMSIAFLGVGAGMATMSGSGGGAATLGVMYIVVVFLLPITVALSYETFFIGKFGATPGKMAAKIKVVTPEGTKITYARALGRYFSKMVSAFTCLIGFIMAAFDDEKRALHDRMCNTRVVVK